MLGDQTNSERIAPTAGGGGRGQGNSKIACNRSYDIRWSGLETDVQVDATIRIMKQLC